MSVSHTKTLLAAAAFFAALPAFAQTAPDAARDASFLPDAVPVAVPTFTGLASPGQTPSDPTQAPSMTPVAGPTTSTTPLTGATVPVTPAPAATTLPPAAPIPAPVLVPPPAAVPASPAPIPAPQPVATTAPAPLAAPSPAPVTPAPAVIPLSVPPAPVAVPLNQPTTTAVAAPPAPAPPEKTFALITPVETATLPSLGPESIGVPGASALSAGMWKGTPRLLAEKLLAIATLTASPVLNDLARRLLVTPAAPPEGSGAFQNLTALRIQKLVEFGDTPSAWSLASHSDAKSLDDPAFHAIVDDALGDMIDLCARLPDFAAARAAIDWQEDQVICQLRANDVKAAQVTLDVMRARPVRDDMFIEVATRNMLGNIKDLPHQITPLTPAMLGLLRLTDLPLPSELYGHPDFAFVPSLLQAKSKQDVAQLGLAERAAQRGVIAPATLAVIYKQISFTPDELANPLTASESGSRQHALLYQAALAEKEPARRVADIARFIQNASPALLNGAGSLLAEMAAGLRPDPAYGESAFTLACAEMLAGHNETALQWLRLAPPSRRDMAAEDYRALWPQFVLAGLESSEAFPADLSAWLAATFKADTTDGQRVARAEASAALLMLDANGFAVPPEAWARLLAAPHNEKHITLPPALLERLQAAGSGQRQAETILLATALAGDGDIPLPAAVAISHALREAGFKTEAAIFARHIIALGAGN